MKKGIKILSILIASVAFSSCSELGFGIGTEQTMVITDVQEIRGLDNIHEFRLPNAEGSEPIVINDEEAYRKLQNLEVSKDCIFPKIDFSERTLLGLYVSFGGYRPIQPLYKVEINDAAETYTYWVLLSYDSSMNQLAIMRHEMFWVTIPKIKSGYKVIGQRGDEYIALGNLVIMQNWKLLEYHNDTVDIRAENYNSKSEQREEQFMLRFETDSTFFVKILGDTIYGRWQQDEYNEGLRRAKIELPETDISKYNNLPEEYISFVRQLFSQEKEAYYISLEEKGLLIYTPYKNQNGVLCKGWHFNSGIFID